MVHAHPRSLLSSKKGQSTDTLKGKKIMEESQSHGAECKKLESKGYTQHGCIYTTHSAKGKTAGTENSSWWPGAAVGLTANGPGRMFGVMNCTVSGVKKKMVVKNT